jgi:hypothetical protein
MSINYPQVERRKNLSPDEFRSRYVDRAPVVIEGVLDEWRALSLWDSGYFRRIAPAMRVKVKSGYLPKGEVEFLPFAAYLDMVDEYETKLQGGQAGPRDRPSYLHDVPLLAMLPQLVDDVRPFPGHYLPGWYQHEWWRFTQFFFGPSHSLTPLHFDSLETHNIFFQVEGRKRFILIGPHERKNCYIYNWRWSDVDPENPDLDRHPNFSKVTPTEVTVGPGDVLYMPPGTLHNVRSLERSISFNIDWQTRATALRGMSRIVKGMPVKNVYYNAVVAFGLWTGIPSKAVFPLYRSYLDYVS